MINLDGCVMRMGTHEDANRILELINLIQPKTPWSNEHFMWQLFSDQSKGSKIYLILSDEAVVSLYIAVKKKFYVHGEIKEGFVIQDVMTHPNFRGHGFLNYLAKLCVKDIIEGGYFAYVFPNKLSENSFRRNEWTELTRIPLRTMKVNSFDKNFKVLEEELVEPIVRFDEKVTRIWIDSGLLIGTYRDASFLNWRYSRPGSTYFKFYLKKDKGYFVLKIFDLEGERVLHLLDIVVSRSSRDLIKPALEFIKGFASMNSVGLITCWLNQGHPYSSIFDEFGFSLNSNSDRFSFVMSPAKELKIFSNVTGWHLTQGDGDVY